ncbi:MAG: AAA family ATPase, partial [Caldilineaceae bacterium]|nr:AAA family ATPase [Caldilineaceae bacterium]
ELTLLRTIWQKVSGSSPQRRGQGQLIGITGEAGIGKSRLVQGFATLLATDAVDPQPQWLSLRAPSTYQAAPYEIVVQLLRTLLNVPQLGGAVPRLANTMPSNSAGAWQVAGGNPHDSLHAIHHAQSASPSEVIEAPVPAAKVAAATTLDGPTLTAVLQSLPGMQPGAHLAEMAALLGELFDLPTEGATIAHLDLPTRQRRLAQLLGTLLAQRTQTTPLILWLDDLHLVDDSSLALLEQLAAGLDRLPILVLATFRADGTWQPPWWHRRNYQQIHLDALSDDATTELLCTLLESEQLPNALQALFVERSGGHPLFVQELVTSLAEAGALVRGAAGWQLHGAQHDAQVPGTIQRVLLSRIDSLPEQAQRVLTVAATIGDPADPALLRAALEPTLQADALEQALTTLETRNLLYQPWGSMAYHFHHSLLRDVAYAGMALEERRRTHRRLAELLESTLRSEPTEVEQLPILAQLAHHYFHSVVTPTATGSVRIATDTPLAARQRAAHYLQQAGERAHQKYAARSAIQHYQRALDLVATLPDATAHRPALLDRLGAAHEIVTEFPQAIATLRQLHEHYVAHPATVSPAIQAELARRIGRLYERQSDYATALTWIERGLALLAIADQEEDS